MFQIYSLYKTVYIVDYLNKIKSYVIYIKKVRIFICQKNKKKQQ